MWRSTCLLYTSEIDPLKQAIADSWPDSLDDSCAREEWDWMPQYDLESMTVDMLEKLRDVYKRQPVKAALSSG